MNCSSNTPTKTKTSLFKLRAAISLFGTLSLGACGTGPYDLSNESDRATMKVEIKQALTQNDCGRALSLSTQLYQSAYSDNESRMLYAASHACNEGIQLYPLLDQITAADFGSPDAIIRSIVKFFPSTSADSKMPSAWYAQDALLSVLIPGTVIAPADLISASANNLGSVLSQDRTLDSNTYLLFIAMSVVGTTLSRNGTPVAGTYAQGTSLSWTAKAAVQSDTTGAACAIVAGFFNMFDGIGAVVGLLGGATSSQLKTIVTLLSTDFDLKGKAECIADPYSVAQCSAAATRIRYRGACAEQGPAASYAAGVIKEINLLWLP